MCDCGHPGGKEDAFEVLMARTEVGDLLFRGAPTPRISGRLVFFPGGDVA
jgi:hypothetical protein